MKMTDAAAQNPLRLPSRTSTASGISWIDRGVGLDEILIIFYSETSAPDSTDDTHRHSTAEPEGIADGEGNIAHFNFAGIREGQYRQMVRRDFHDGDVGAWIHSHNFAFQFTVIGKHHVDIRGTL